MNYEGIALLLFALFCYFLPTAIAQARNHPALYPLFGVNLLLGWTVLGWFIALIWSFVGGPAVTVVTTAAPPQEPARIPCPHCAEPVMPAAKVCKHCGRDILPPDS